MSRLSNDAEVLDEAAALLAGRLGIVELVAEAAADVPSLEAEAPTLDDHDLDVVFTTDDPEITPDGTITFADGEGPTNDELLEAVVELAHAQAEANADIQEVLEDLIADVTATASALNALLASLRSAGMLEA